MLSCYAMWKVIALSLYVVAVLFACGPTQASAHARACAFFGFTIAGTTSFAASPSWTSIELQNRLKVVNDVSVNGRAIVLQPLAQARVHVHRVKSLTVTATHSGTALFACSSG